MRLRDGWTDPFLLAAAAILLGWIAFAVAELHHWSAWPIGVLGSVFGLLSFHRGRTIAERRHSELQIAAEASAEQIRELELLRGLTATLLTFQSPDDLFGEVAKVARDLTRADASAVLLRSGEGLFLRVAAASGLLAPAAGRLLPVDESAAGGALAGTEPVAIEQLSLLGKVERFEGVADTFDRMIGVPLLSRGYAIGVVAVYNRADRPAFDALDIQGLMTLSEQVAVGLDRSAMLDDARRNERILEQTNRELVEATQLKSQFLANMSHELRTPLNAIIGFSDLLLGEGPLDETQRDYLGSIARQGRHLLDLINSVLDVAKLEAGRMAVRLSRFDIRTVVQAAVKDTDSLRAVKRQTCGVEMDATMLDLAADQQKVRQVLFNLLSNASKFTDTGGTVTVLATRSRMPLPVIAADGTVSGVKVRDAVWVAVRDTGIGIAPADQAKLFQAFSQVDSSSTRHQQGSGLGLALCKQFVELHGGTIGVESIVGQGSTFWFVLPVAGPEPEQAG